MLFLKAGLPLNIVHAVTIKSVLNLCLPVVLYLLMGWAGLPAMLYLWVGLPAILLGGPAPDYFCRGLPAILLDGSAGLGCNTIEHLQKIFT